MARGDVIIPAKFLAEQPQTEREARWAALDPVVQTYLAEGEAALRRRWAASMAKHKGGAR